MTQPCGCQQVNYGGGNAFLIVLVLFILLAIIGYIIL